ncbi:glycosyltransferase family 2 protein [Mixia osmundae IAM 14324]|uniref:Glycosyltransferase 2-like domain-containing protein n=1 Tax=Mixia osmundae (strain CBS 9802 / IAM 14324 / JCM 22182 / KY 12970) TaxID=764103 RepID=G7DV48_MIXOS|nr:glycosyltransferase family 2 protein [Mixia osmundae IAM 14324]KEI36325.1 glycosyltransferase family 2 protein [Mixia osmundae IAM 14324]GAA94458.1 hypothetical protein E5Q_01110 [Mixia osmundae IAM 14324]
MPASRQNKGHHRRESASLSLSASGSSASRFFTPDEHDRDLTQQLHAATVADQSRSMLASPHHRLPRVQPPSAETTEPVVYGRALAEPESAASPALAVRPPTRPHPEAKSSTGEIRFKVSNDTRGGRAIYRAGSPVSAPEPAARPPMPASRFSEDDEQPKISFASLSQRRESLVRAEDYMPDLASQYANRSIAVGHAPPRANSITFVPSLETALSDDGKTDSPEEHDLSNGALDFDRMKRLLRHESHAGLPIFLKEGHRLSAMPADEKRDRTMGGKALLSSKEWKEALQINHGGIPQKLFNDEKALRRSSVDHYLGIKQAGPEVLQEQDEAASSIRRILLAISPITAIVAQLAAVFYLSMRLRFLISASEATGRLYLSAWLFFAFELVFALFGGVYMLRTTYKRCFRMTQRLSLRGEMSLPTVDVLVLCTGEDDQLAMDAAIAACKLDWPVDRLRVLLIDDAGSMALQVRANKYAEHRALHLTYHRRVKTKPMSRRHAKASAINFGLTETRMHGRIAGEYVMVLSASSLPDPSILRASIAHMVQNQQISLVTSETSIYNLSTPVSQSLSCFINSMEPEERASTGYVLRRTTLDNIGGFPTGSAFEDDCLSSLIQGKGLTVQHLDQTLTHSLVPESYAEHVRQRMQTTTGHLRTAKRLGFFVRNARIADMTFAQRFSKLCFALAPLTSILALLATIALPVSLYLGQFTVTVLTVGELNFLLRSLFVSVLAERLHDLCFSLSSGQPTMRRKLQSLAFVASYDLIALFRALKPASKVYLITQDESVARQGPSERDVKARLPLHLRSYNVLFRGFAWIQLVIFAGVLSSVIYACATAISAYADGSRTLHQTGLLLLLTALWPSMIWINVLAGCWAPISYIIFPPTTPSRERLIHRDPITGIATPICKAGRVRPLAERKLSEYFVCGLSTAFVIVTFVLSCTNLDIQ